MSLVVSGRVQGVGFRAFAQRAALEAGAVGWVRNRANGDVEVWAEGEPEVLDRLAGRLRVGPPHADVRSLHRDDRDATGAHPGFEIRFDGGD